MVALDVNCAFSFCSVVNRNATINFLSSLIFFWFVLCRADSNDIMNRSSASGSQKSTPLHLVSEHKQSTVAARQHSRTVAEAESSSTKSKTPNWNNGASCRKLKLGTQPRRICTGPGVKTVVVKSPKSGPNVTVQLVQTGAVRQLVNWSSNSTPVSGTGGHDSALSCKSTSSYGKSAQSFASRPSGSVCDQRSASLLNAPTSVNLTTSTCLQSSDYYQSEHDVAMQPSEHIHSQHFLFTPNASGPAASTRSPNSSSCAKKTVNYAPGCTVSVPNDSLVILSPSYRYVTQESASSKTQTSVGCKVGTVSRLAPKRAHTDASCLHQSESKPVSQPKETNSGQLRSKPTVSHVSPSERFSARQSASCAKTKTPVNCPEFVSFVRSAKSAENYGKRCAKSVQLLAHTTPENNNLQPTGCSTLTPSYSSRGLKSSVDAKLSSEYTANVMKSTGSSALKCPKHMNSRKAAVIAKPAVYYSSGQWTTDTPSSGERNSKFNLPADSVHRKTSKPEPDVVAKAISLQPNSGVTKKKVKKKKKSSTLIKTPSEVKNLLEVFGDKKLHGAANTAKPGAFVRTFTPVYTPAFTGVFSHAQPDVISEEDMDTSDTVNEVLVT